MKSVIYLCVALLFPAVLSVGPVAADPTPRVLTMTGEGEVRAVPDCAQLTAGVLTEGPTAALALSVNSKTMQEVFAAITKLGVPSNALQTSNISIAPQYPPYNSGQPHRIISYQVSNDVAISLDDVAKIGPAFDALAQAGANQAGNVSFGLKDYATPLAEARAKAVVDATLRAQTYAKAANVTLGPILSITEGGSAGLVRPITMNLMKASPPTPVATGEENISASVTIVWEIK